MNSINTLKVARLIVMGMVAVSLTSIAWAQQSELESVKLEPDEESKLFVLPELTAASDATYSLARFQIKIERVNDKVKFEARPKGKSENLIVHWESTATEEPVHLVFNTKDKRFQRLENKVRVVLTDYSELDALIEDTDATRGKAYPTLGYAILELPAEKHPAKFVKSLESRVGVESAFVMVERLPEIPL